MLSFSTPASILLSSVATVCSLPHPVMEISLLCPRHCDMLRTGCVSLIYPKVSLTLLPLCHPQCLDGLLFSPVRLCHPFLFSSLHNLLPTCRCVTIVLPPLAVSTPSMKSPGTWMMGVAILVPTGPFGLRWLLLLLLKPCCYGKSLPAGEAGYA